MSAEVDSSRLDAEQLCYLTTTGRVSGKPHEIAIWFAFDHGPEARVFMLSGGRGGSDWIKNLRRDPRVQVTISGRRYGGQATVIEGANEDPKARRLLATKYQGWSEGNPLSTWASTSLPVRIDLVGP